MIRRAAASIAIAITATVPLAAPVGAWGCGPNRKCPTTTTTSSVPETTTTAVSTTTVVTVPESTTTLAPVTTTTVPDADIGTPLSIEREVPKSIEFTG